MALNTIQQIRYGSVAMNSLIADNQPSEQWERVYNAAEAVALAARRDLIAEMVSKAETEAMGLSDWLRSFDATEVSPK